MESLKEFLLTGPSHWDPEQPIQRFQLNNGEQISCILWNHLFFMTGTDIVRTLMYRFQLYGRQVKNLKKFEEGVFSDLRNLKPGIDAVLEEPRSEFLEMLYRNNCIRTQKKQKVFFWYSVPHDRLFLDALERDVKREAAGIEPATIVIPGRENEDNTPISELAKVKGESNDTIADELAECKDSISSESEDSTQNDDAGNKKTDPILDHPLAHPGIPARAYKFLIDDLASLSQNQPTPAPRPMPQMDYHSMMAPMHLQQQHHHMSGYGHSAHFHPQMNMSSFLPPQQALFNDLLNDPLTSAYNHNNSQIFNMDDSQRQVNYSVPIPQTAQFPNIIDYSSNSTPMFQSPPLSDDHRNQTPQPTAYPDLLNLDFASPYTSLLHSNPIYGQEFDRVSHHANGKMQRKKQRMEWATPSPYPFPAPKARPYSTQPQTHQQPSTLDEAFDPAQLSMFLCNPSEF
jgi:hypothetical protein